MSNLQEKISMNTSIDGLDFFIAKLSNGIKYKMVYINGFWEETMVSYLDSQKKFIFKFSNDPEYVKAICKLAKRCGFTIITQNIEYFTYFYNKSADYEDVSAPLYYEEDGAYYFKADTDDVHMISCKSLKETEILEKMFLCCVEDYEFLYILKKEIATTGYYISNRPVTSNLLLRYNVTPLNEYGDYIYYSKKDASIENKS